MKRNKPVNPIHGDRGSIPRAGRGPLRVAIAAVTVLLALPAAGPLSAAAGDRSITVVNQCPGQTVRVGINGGRLEDCGDGATCPAGTSCLVVADVEFGCFWTFPTPSSGSPVLGPNAKVVYELDNPAYCPGGGSPPCAPGVSPIKWSGNVYAATECDAKGESCLTGMCVSSQDGQTSIAPCLTGVGPQGPVTLAEFTLQQTAVDFYDVSVINGVNVPVSMVPGVSTTQQGDPYFCQGPGSPTKSSTGLLGCSWSFDPTIDGTDRKVLLRVVSPGGGSCATDADCTKAGQVCGRALEYGTTDIEQTCGDQIGWWTADELCVYSANAFGDPVACSQAVPQQGTRTNLYGCDGFNSNSCYNEDEANSTCCGCPDWVIEGTKLPLAPGFQCHDTNPQWTNIALPWAAFVKNACPTAYSFPFDDATSTFTCATPEQPSTSSPNSTGYTITFCPGGNVGF